MLYPTGKTRRQAHEIDPLGQSQTWRGALSSQNVRTFYRFTVDEPRLLNLSLKGLRSSSSAALAVLNRRGKSIASFQGKNLGRVSSIVLNSGTYFIRVSRRKGRTNYRLRLSNDPYSDVAGNSPEFARSLQLTSTSKSYTDYIGKSLDPEDYYVFSLPSRSTNVFIELSSPNAEDVRLDLLNDRYQRINLSGENSEDSRQRNVLAAGTYFVRVKSSSNLLTRYTLTLSGETIEDNWFGNDRLITAYPLPINFSGTIQGFVGTGNPSDYFKLPVAERLNLAPSLPQATTVLSNEPVQLRYTLITSAGVRLGMDGRIGANLSPGTYYLEVLSLQGDAYYNLRVQLRYPSPNIFSENIFSDFRT